ncbi:MAG: exosome complex exonuclease Rrp41 [Candidatus Aenigmarchaeota archaeon ex4484_52]|nr:MAG: exosome complex exonuclease Rrp41 [Candidatus Aenigmarchaeota archaeon ex4484_52]
MRLDKRADDQLRPIKIQLNVIKQALGSCYFEMGKTRVIAATYGPQEVHPKHIEESDKCILMCNYNMLPFSVDGNRKKPGYDRRSVEISKVVREALEPAVFTEEYPRCAINIDMQIIQADAGTRVAAINATSLCLCCAGIAMRDIVVSVAVGRANKKILVDLTKQEEDADDAIDMPIAIMPREKKITLLQMDGIASIDEIKEIINKSFIACDELSKIHRAVLNKNISNI